MEEDEESDVEDGDITMLNTEVIYSALVGELNIYSSYLHNRFYKQIFLLHKTSIKQS